MHISLAQSEQQYIQSVLLINKQRQTEAIVV